MGDSDSGGYSVSNLGRAVLRHLSGGDTVVVTNNGGNTKPPDVNIGSNQDKTQLNGNNNSDKIDNQGQCIGDCKKNLCELGSKLAKVQCFKCGGEACNKCAGLTKPEANKLNERADLFWACDGCVGHVKSPSVAASMTDNYQGQADLMKDIIINEMVPKMVKDITESVTKSIVPSLTSALGGLDSDSTAAYDENFPEDDFQKVITKKQQKQAALQVQALKDEATKHRISENSRDGRLKNIVLFRVTEPEGDTPEERQLEDEKFINDLLVTLKVNEPENKTVDPKKVYRLGKYDKNKAQQGSARPIKVELNSKTDVSLIMSNAKNLKEADGKFREVNISYDLSESERAEVNILLKEAHEKTKNSSEHIWKVKGQPGSMELVRYKKRPAQQ